MRPIYRQKEADRAKWLLSLPGGDHLTHITSIDKVTVLHHLHLSDRLNPCRYQGRQMDMGQPPLETTDNIRQQPQRIMECNNIPILSTSLI